LRDTWHFSNDYNQTRAAKTLGMSRDTLRYRMKKFEIQEESS
jgi:DNA-binding protein Fis